MDPFSPRWKRLALAVLPPYGAKRDIAVINQVRLTLIRVLKRHAGEIGFAPKLIPVGDDLLPFLAFLAGASTQFSSACFASPIDIGVLARNRPILQALFLDSEIDAISALGESTPKALGSNVLAARDLGDMYGAALLSNSEQEAISAINSLFELNYMQFMQREEKRVNVNVGLVPTDSWKARSIQVPLAELRGRIAHTPSIVSLLIGTVCILVALAFPPFELHAPEGLTINAGFAFLFDPPTYGKVAAVVNVGLLGLELATIAFATITASVCVHLITRNSTGSDA